MEAIGDNGAINTEFVKTLGEVENGYTYLREEDVAFAKITPCFENGKGALMRGLRNGIAFGTTELTVARAKRSKIIPQYIRWLFSSPNFRGLGEGWMYGAGGQKRVPDDFLRNFEVPLPSLLEQKSLCSFLGRETAKIDVLIEEQKRLIELLREKRQAVISHAVTKGLDPSAPMKDSGVEWLGQVPAHWEILALKRLIKMQSGESITSESIEDIGPFPVFGGNGIRGFTRDYTHEGDFVLIGRQGALCGNINYANGKFWASEHAVVVTPILEINMTWLGELLRSMDLNQYSTSAAQPGLSVEVIGNLLIPLPPGEEQEKIADLSITHMTHAERLVAEAEAAIALLQERRAALISAAVTGKIDVRGLVAQEAEAAQ